MRVKFLCGIRAVFIVLILLIVCFPFHVFAADDDAKRLEQKLDALEKRTDDLEKEIRQEHKPLLKEISEHIATLEKDIDTVDYRTARIKALSEKVKSFSIGGDLSLFLQGIAANSQGLQESADASYSGDLFFIAPIGPYGDVYFRGDVGQGDGIAPYLPPTFSGPNADMEFNQPRFELVEAWYWTEFPIPDIRDKRLELTVGKIDPTALFDANTAANSETSQFIADIFVNNLAIEFGGDANGYGAGFSTAYRFTSIYDKGLKVVGRIGMFEGDGDFRDVLDSPFLIAEVDTWMPFYGLNGNYRIYGWANKNKHTDFLDASKDNLSNKGFGISLDQQISNDITLFARYGIQDEDVSKFDETISIGGRLLGNGWRRGNDVVGIAYGASHVSSKYKQASLGLDGYAADADYEKYVEAYYKYWANNNLSISPDIQYIVNPGGDKQKDSIFIYGIRMQAAF